MRRLLISTLALLGLGALTACQERPPSEPAVIEFIETLGTLTNDPSTSCDDVGKALDQHFDDQLTDDVASALRRLSVGPRRFDEPTEERLAEALRNFGTTALRCQSNPAFQTALERLERARGGDA